MSLKSGALILATSGDRGRGEEMVGRVGEMLGRGEGEKVGEMVRGREEKVWIKMAVVTMAEMGVKANLRAGRRSQPRSERRERRRSVHVEV